MSLLQRYVIAQYVKTSTAIYKMTELAQLDIKIDLSLYNFLQHTRFIDGQILKGLMK